MEAKKVSIIIAIYNGEEYFERCLSSVLRQSYKNMQIILVNDGSTDGTAALCEAYKEKDSRIVCIHKENGGLSSARNAGLDMAEGDYIAFLDIDDYISDDFLKEMVGVIETTGVDVAHCIKEMGNLSDYDFPLKAITPIVYEKMDYLRHMFDFHDFDGFPFKVYKKHLFDQIRFPLNRICEDVATTHLVIYAAEKVAYYPQKLYYYFESSSSIMRGNYRPEKASKLLSFEERIAFFEELGEAELVDKLLKKYMAVLLREYYYASSGNYVDLKREIRRKIKDTSGRIGKSIYISQVFKIGTVGASIVPYLAGAVCNYALSRPGRKKEVPEHNGE